MKGLLTIENLSFSYEKKRPLLEDISFSVERGQIFSLIGPNGTGKTTLLNCLVGELCPKAGTVTLDGKDLLHMPPAQRAQRLGYVPQLFKSDVHLTVMDYLLLGRTPYTRFRHTKEDIRLVEEGMEEVGIADYALRDIRHLSGGERQKVSIARALVQQPTLLLLDEPTSALDIRNQLDVLQLLRRICRQRQLMVLLSIHDLSLSLRYSDAAAMLHHSRIAYSGPTCEVIRPQSVREVYGVQVDVVDGQYIHLLE